MRGHPKLLRLQLLADPRGCVAPADFVSFVAVKGVPVNDGRDGSGQRPKSKQATTGTLKGLGVDAAVDAVGHAVLHTGNCFPHLL